MSIKLPDYFVTDKDVLDAYSTDWSGEKMVPQYLVRPKSKEEIVECLKFCNENNIPTTPAGAQSCDTASSLSETGVCMSTNQMKKIIEINPEEGYAIAEPGVFVGDLKKELSADNLLYAPDPTSENIATLGGTVATNAGGARGFKYGQTADHVLGVELVLADGNVIYVEKDKTSKRSTGPTTFNNLTELMSGSEGIFGVFSKIKVKISKGIPDAYAMVCFFDTMENLVQFAIDIRDNKFKGVSPRSLEYMDNSCLDILRDGPKAAQVPAGSQGAVILEQEYTEENFEETLDAWLEVLEKSTPFSEATIVADTEAKIVELRELRHHLPATLNERGALAGQNGGRKVSTDWAVPLEKFPEMMKKGEELSIKFGFGPERTFRYAHLGDGHPHYNFVPENTEELKQCLELRRELSKLAVSLGGTVAGEHGIGKHRKDLFEFEEPSLKIRLMKALKKELDPKGLMAPGNLF